MWLVERPWQVTKMFQSREPKNMCLPNAAYRWPPNQREHNHLDGRRDGQYPVFQNQCDSRFLRARSVAKRFQPRQTK